MDCIDQLLHLRQGCLSIFEYVYQFCELSYEVPLYDELLFTDLFQFGLNEPVKSCLPAGGFNGSLKDCIDYALLCAGSSFTVGVAGSAPGSAPEPAPSQELAGSAPEPAPSQELAGSAPEPAPSQELAGSAPESAQLSFISAGPAQLSAGPAQLSFVSAGPAQLSFLHAASVQFGAALAFPRPSTSRMSLDVRTSRVPP